MRRKKPDAGCFTVELLYTHRNSSSRERADNFDRSDRFDRGEDRRDDHDRNRLLITKRSFSREKEERSRDREQRGPADPVRRVASMTDDRDRARSREKNGGWQSAPHCVCDVLVWS